MLKLNVGCGNDIKEGFVNIDIANLPGVDIVCNINEGNLPYDTGTVDYVYCQNILEHVDLPKVLKEIHRVLKTGGKLFAVVPHFTSSDNFSDPTHINRFSFRTWQFFSKESKFGRDYYFDFSFEKIEYAKIKFFKTYIYNIPIQWFVNLGDFTRKIYEDTFLRVFPAWYIEVVLIK